MLPDSSPLTICILFNFILKDKLDYHIEITN